MSVVGYRLTNLAGDYGDDLGGAAAREAAVVFIL